MSNHQFADGGKPSLPVRTGAAVLLGIAAVACDDGVSPPPEPEPVTIAGTRSATGSLGVEGMHMARGFELAVKMLNDTGGIDGRDVRIILLDDESDPGKAADLYRELAAADSIDLLIGPYASSITSAVVPVAEAAGRPLITPQAASHRIWNGQGRSWSVQMLNDARHNLAGAVVIGARLGAETAAMVYEDSSFPVSAAEGVRAAAAEEGLTLVMDESYPVGGADHGELVSRARDLGADLFLGGGYTQDAVAFTTAVARAEYTPVLSSWNVGPGHPDFPDRVGIDAARCVVGNAPWVASLTTSGLLATAATFVMRYREEYGAEPGYQAAAGFGAIELLAEAARASVASHGEIVEAAVRDYLFSTSTGTVLGPYGVVPLGDPDAGSQRRLVRLQLQWQDDDEGGLVQRVIYPDGAAEAEPCTTGPIPSR